MTSTSALIGNFGQANYMAAKLGIVGLSRGIALDMARFKVRSNAIAPFAWSRMIDSIPTETEAEKERVERLKQMTPEKIAPLVVYLVLRQGRRHLRADLRRAQQRDVPVHPDRGRCARCIAPTAGRRRSSTQQLKGAFGPSLTPLERSGDVFSWDPV